MADTTLQRKPREILLLFNDRQYTEAGRYLRKLRAAGAPSNTAAILDALRIASTMTSPSKGEDK